MWTLWRPLLSPSRRRWSVERSRHRAAWRASREKGSFHRGGESTGDGSRARPRKTRKSWIEGRAATGAARRGTSVPACGGVEAWTGGGRLPDADPELGSVGRRAPAVPPGAVARDWGRRARPPAVSLSSDPFQNFHLWSLCSGFTNPRGGGEEYALQVRSSQEQQPSTPRNAGSWSSRPGPHTLGQMDVCPDAAAATAVCSGSARCPAGASPWLTCDPVCPFPLWASVLASVQWVVQTREAVMPPSSPVHLEIQVFGWGKPRSQK